MLPATEEGGGHARHSLAILQRGAELIEDVLRRESHFQWPVRELWCDAGVCCKHAGTGEHHTTRHCDSAHRTAGIFGGGRRPIE